MNKENKAKWHSIVEAPVRDRQAKPRHSGLTMIIDKGLGLTETKELLELASPYVDFIKLGFGTSALYSFDLLQKKVRLVREKGVNIFPGGTFLEVAVLQKKLESYLEMCGEVGYNFVEVSDGTIDMSREERKEVMYLALSMGFQVIAEVGKKDPRDAVLNVNIKQQIEENLEWGAYKVIIEGRESGQGVVIYDLAGNIRVNEMEDLANCVSNAEQLLWEAPLKKQQQELIVRFGTNVNLGNIQPGDILALEALRLGLRADTLRNTLRKVVLDSTVV